MSARFVFALSLALASSTAAFAGETPLLASVAQREMKRPVPDMSAERPESDKVYEMTFLLYCLAALSTRHPDDAITACGRVIELDPNNPAGFKLRGMAYFGTNDYPAALLDLDRAAALDPGDAETQATRGAAFRAMRQTSRALEAYSQAIALDPSESKWWNARCWTRAVAHEGLKSALADCSRAIALDPRSANAYDSRGLVYLELGRAKEAESDYARALTYEPGRASALFGRGVAKLRLGDAMARADIERAIAADPSIIRTFANYGVVVNVEFLRGQSVKPGADSHPSAPATRPGNRPVNDTRPTRSARAELSRDAHNLYRP